MPTGSDPGKQERSSYLMVAVIFLVSCGLAAAAVAIHDAGGVSMLLGSRLEDFDPGAADDPDPAATEAPVPAAPKVRKREPPTRPVMDEAALAAAAALGEGQLIVRCNRPCRVSVDGTLLGEAAPVLRTMQPAGQHQVRVELLDGDDLATRKVLIAPDRDRELSFTLGGKAPVKDLRDLEGTEDWD